METKSFDQMSCSVARSLEHVGEWWNILIIRDAMHGIKRFDGFVKSLGITPNTLTRRLNGLVEAGLLTKQRYSEHPPRDEYILSDKGREFFPILATLMAWGNKHYSPHGIDTLLVDAKTKHQITPVLIDKHTGRELNADEILFCAGPASSSGKINHYASLGLPHIPIRS
ncbi:MAG: winged helix-turn-helix transcriptional regulator [Methylophilaceae bacterium]